jgi:hypothetical protein
MQLTISKGKILRLNTYILVRVRMDLEMAILIGMMLTAAGLALLGKVLKQSISSRTNPMKGGRESQDKIIEIYDYEIVDEIQNRASKGYKVAIHD